LTLKNTKPEIKMIPFKPQDLIEAHETEAKGIIIQVDDSCPDVKIKVRWDNFEGEHWYPLSELQESVFITSSPTSCQHTYTEYKGLRETFSYCTKCDHKL